MIVRDSEELTVVSGCERDIGISSLGMSLAKDSGSSGMSCLRTRGTDSDPLSRPSMFSNSGWEPQSLNLHARRRSQGMPTSRASLMSSDREQTPS